MNILFGSSKIIWTFYRHSNETSMTVKSHLYAAAHRCEGI